MKVLTIKQPWATLIAEGLKEYEFRTWKTNYRGEVLIHAGLGVDKRAMMRFSHLGLTYPQGCIIAKATIQNCIYVDDSLRHTLEKKEPFVYQNVIQDKEWEGYAFHLTHVEKISPISIKGKLGLWNYENTK